MYSFKLCKGITNQISKLKLKKKRLTSKEDVMKKIVTLRKNTLIEIAISSRAIYQLHSNQYINKFL